VTRRATIADVAARSSVSTATVSRVLAGVGRSRPETRSRVMAAVDELAYRPSGVARALRMRATLILGLLVTDIENPFFPHIVRAVEDAAHARGYGILLCNAADEPSRELAYLDLLLDRRVDGIIVASSRATRRHAAVLAGSAMPVVLVNSEVPGGALPAIGTDHRRGARLAAEHLIKLGHRVIGHITAPPTNEAARLRLAGVRDGLRAAGLPPEALHVVEGDGHVSGGQRAAEQLLAVPGLTGLICYNDLSAIGALRTARAVGRRVPEDVSVVGFDDIDLAAWTDPPLTTIRQHTAEMGRWAVERLAAALQAGSLTGSDLERPARAIHLAPELVVRGTTGTPGGRSGEG
jgi:DNA-binding LacI/PurR family transcriptional regulator